jgi:hypothetical protein
MNLRELIAWAFPDLPPERRMAIERLVLAARKEATDGSPVDPAHRPAVVDQAMR